MLAIAKSIMGKHKALGIEILISMPGGNPSQRLTYIGLVNLGSSKSLGNVIILKHCGAILRDQRSDETHKWFIPEQSHVRNQWTATATVHYQMR